MPLSDLYIYGSNLRIAANISVQACLCICGDFLTIRISMPPTSNLVFYLFNYLLPAYQNGCGANCIMAILLPLFSNKKPYDSNF